MKKTFIFSLALVASISASAQTLFNLDGDAFMTAQGAADPTSNFALGANVQITDNDAFTLTTGDADSYKAVAVASNGYNAVRFGNDVLDCTGNGLQGNTNPKGDGGASCNSDFAQPTTGAYYVLTAKQDGYIYVVHKASSNKNYTVFEEGTCLAYEFAMNIAEDPNTTTPSSVLYFSLPADADGYYDTSNGSILWPIQIFHNNSDAASAGNGLGVIKFPVYADCTYRFNACGSKMSLKGVYFSANPVAVSLVGEDGISTLPLLSETGAAGIAGVEVKDEAADANAPVYNIAGQRVSKNAKGLVIINGKKVLR